MSTLLKVKIKGLVKINHPMVVNNLKKGIFQKRTGNDCSVHDGDSAVFFLLFN